MTQQQVSTADYLMAMHAQVAGALQTDCWYWMKAELLTSCGESDEGVYRQVIIQAWGCLQPAATRHHAAAHLLRDKRQYRTLLEQLDSEVSIYV